MGARSLVVVAWVGTLGVIGPSSRQEVRTELAPPKSRGFCVPRGTVPRRKSARVRRRGLAAKARRATRARRTET